ncbi:TrkH family potassium uptake protein [Desulfotalea psychrophila]|uniref:Related to V-type sodium ATP synthase, subunit J n=1 Tax=Desulfotalea psychrophila (strain LSv54 / DSM 12343) TaxID=177439 RepID=Q6APM2_DESPS|nr:potassium transporter TrkG [Desulfotalea psychrophila]CAG35702.1 related to V-type sodium ATP synthase, subunit J [Desulfotalea psychrophila LSv54]
MKVAEHFYSSLSRFGLEGASLVLFPLPLLLFDRAEMIGGNWRFYLALLASCSSLICAFSLHRRPLLGKFFGLICSAAILALIFFHVLADPFVALPAAIIYIGIVFFLLDFRGDGGVNLYPEAFVRYTQRAWWASFVVMFLVLLDLLMPASVGGPYLYIVLFSFAMAQLLLFLAALSKRSTSYLCFTLFTGLSVALSACFFGMGNIATLILFLNILTLVVLPRGNFLGGRRELWWEVLFDHPARILLVSFLSLSVFGTFLLSFPFATEAGGVGLLDAAFTSVSAVCVTGLTVLDTATDFSLWGQIAILLLIQFGGLGIMSITAVALHAMGRRLSLKQERILTSIADSGSQGLLESLSTILKFTFVVEGVGASLLALVFYCTGDTPLLAIWRGIFTAISAFCNAGFALQSDSLVSYQTNPFVLHLVAILIILGGLAPATSLIIPSWLRGKAISIPARIALITSLALLFTGTFFILAFEWNGALAGLSIFDKINNAWFQSASLRTAGFNSIEFAHLCSSSFLVMLFLMFIGGSPGSTAGGVKTVSIGILAITFWRNITNRHHVIFQGRVISPSTIFRAITVIISGMIVWFFLVLMLTTTQQIFARDIVFEVTSALSTVGLTLGATPLLDGMGKVIVMLAMFIGRIGPTTIFMLLSSDEERSSQRRPEVKISLT